MVDQEGGLIRRLPGAPALSEKRIGQSADPVAAAAAAGTGAGRALARPVVRPAASGSRQMRADARGLSGW